MRKEVHLLSDKAMQRFIQNGYVTIKPDFPASFHQRIYQKTEEMFEKVGNPGNNLLPRIPELRKVFGHPAVRGALTSILGEDYYLHPHRHCHENPPDSGEQGMHKDSLHNSRFAVDENHRHHRTRWAMAFYYPQDTPLELGPTGIWPSSQYFNTQPPFGKDKELPLDGEAGTVVIVHYDVFHRKMLNTSDKVRYMVKFLFTRMSEPQYPSWNHQGATWETTDDLQELTWQNLWNWYLGKNEKHQNGTGTRSLSELTEKLSDESEAISVNAAYELGHIGNQASSLIMDSLKGQDEVACRNASYAFNSMGQSAIPSLTEILRDKDEKVRARAADALGDLGFDAQEAAVDLIETLNDESKDVRNHATEALGTITQTTDIAVAPLAERLTDDEDLIRRNAALSLARIGKKASAALPALSEALYDNNHFVRAFSLQALERIGTEEATKTSVDYLRSARWCTSH